MRFCLRLATAALSAAMLLSVNAPAAQPDGRAIIVARQQIREELSRAMSNGRLSRMDQYRILLHARDTLPPEDVRGLQRTLDRLAAASEGRGRSTSPYGATARPDVPDAARNRAMLTAYNDSGEADAGESALSATPQESPIYEVPDGVPSGAYAHDPLALEPFEHDTGVLAQPGAFMDELQMAGWRTWGSLSLFSSVDAFKGPMDLDNLNGNFGLRLGLNGAIPLARARGIGFQAGTSAVLSDFHGTLFTESGSRAQNFTTVGFFQRLPLRGCRTVNWGFGYDFLIDNYFDNLRFGQWRVKLGLEWDPCNEIGLWAAIPDKGDSGLAGPAPFITLEHFRPLPQGNFYWRHTWRNQASTTTWLGIAEGPGDMVFGADGRVPLSRRLAMIANFSYIMPAARGVTGQSDEFWNVSVGIELTPGGNNRCGPNRWAPLLPLADNGSFAVRRIF